jgi:hypothetical protein
MAGNSDRNEYYSGLEKNRIMHELLQKYSTCKMADRVITMPIQRHKNVGPDLHQTSKVSRNLTLKWRISGRRADMLLLSKMVPG